MNCRERQPENGSECVRDQMLSQIHVMLIQESRVWRTLQVKKGNPLRHHQVELDLE
jgi:hypothetical protein